MALTAAVLAAALIAYLVHGRAAAPPATMSGGGTHTFAARKLVITTVAGTGEGGFTPGGGRATDVSLDHPEGLAVDASGDVFIADTNNDLVRELLPDGTLQDVVGHGDQTAAEGQQGVDIKLDHPTGLAIDHEQLYIADTGNNRVLSYDLQSGHVSLVAGSGRAGDAGTPGPAKDAEVTQPTGLAHGLLSSEPNSFAVAETGLIVLDAAGDIAREVEDLDTSIDPMTPTLTIQKGGLPSAAVGSSGVFYLSDSAGAVVYRYSAGSVFSNRIPIVAGDGDHGLFRRRQSGVPGGAVTARGFGPQLRGRPLHLRHR